MLSAPPEADTRRAIFVGDVARFEYVDDDELEDDDDELEDDDDDLDDDDELEDDDDMNEDDDDRGQADPEDRGAAATPPAPVTPFVGSVVPPAAQPPAPQPIPVSPRATYASDPRSRFLPLSDDRVSQLAILDREGKRLTLIRRPFPEPVDRWVAFTYGPGKYRVVQRDLEGRHIGSKTLTIEGETTVLIPTPPSPNGHAETAPSNPLPPPQPSTVSTSAAASGVDWKTALITTGIPVLAGVLTAILKDRREPKSDLAQLAEVAKVLQVGNDERAKLFSEGMSLYRKMAEELPARDRGGDDANPFNMRDILSGVGELLAAFRNGQPARAPAPAAPATTVSAPAAAAPAIPSSVGPAPSVENMTDDQAGAQYVEKLLVTEIQRAVSKGDSPECFVVLVDAYLPPVAVAWLESTPEDEVLAKIPDQFPLYADYLRGEQAQAFLRSALQMMREDAGEEAGVPVAGAVAAQG